MRILVISNLYPPDVLGGYEMGCRQAAEALRTAGHDVRVLTSVPRAQMVPNESHVHRRLKLSYIYDQYSMWKLTPTGRTIRNHEACGVQAFNVHMLGQIVEEFQPDVVYAWNLIGLGGLGLLAAIQHLGLPWVMHLMDNVPETLCALASSPQPVIPPVADAFLRLCRGRFICCSRNTLDEITAAGVHIADRTTIIPNWVTTNGTPNRSDYRHGGQFRMLSAGTFCVHKGTHFVIRAAQLLRDKGHTNFSIDLYGMGTDPAFRAMILSNRLDMVRIHGYREQEEMAHGCVAVMSRVCGISEWFVERADCLKTDRDSEALAASIEKLISGEVSLEAVGRRGARNVLQWFHISTILPRIETELANAIRSGGGRRHSAAEAHRLALLAEKMFQGLVHETAIAA